MAPEEETMSVRTVEVRFHVRLESSDRWRFFDSQRELVPHSGCLCSKRSVSPERGGVGLMKKLSWRKTTKCHFLWQFFFPGLLKPTSYTIPDELSRSLQERQAAIDANFTDGEAEIDVIGVWDRGQRLHIKKELPDTRGGIRCYLPPSAGAQMVQEIAQEVFILVQ